MLHNAINVIIFQLLWWLAVLPSMSQLVWPAAIAAMLLFIHTGLASQQYAAQAIIITSAVTLGFIADTSLSLSGLVQFSGGFYDGALTSWWMALLWAGFATTLLWSMRFVLTWRWEYLALIGGISGVISYAAGWKLEALSFNRGEVIGLLAVFIVWSLCFPSLCRLTTYSMRRYP
jgi:Protein of unknown function (DUF2878)